MKVLLAVHIIGGIVALLSAGGALVTVKGSGRHRLFGRCYVGAMSAVFLSALPLAVFQASLFLVLIGCFSFYLVFSGFRFARNRSGEPQSRDWIAVSGVVLAGISMWVLAYYFLRDGNDQWLTLLFFGGIAILLGISDGRIWAKGGARGRKRIAHHLTNMLAGTIAIVTAVLVVNVTTDPAWIAWIVPTIVITPFIVYWNRRTLSADEI